MIPKYYTALFSLRGISSCYPSLSVIIDNTYDLLWEEGMNEKMNMWPFEMQGRVVVRSCSNPCCVLFLLLGSCPFLNKGIRMLRGVAVRTGSIPNLMETRICVPTMTGQGLVSAPGEPASPLPRPERLALLERGGGDLVPPSGGFQVCIPVRDARGLDK